MSNCPLLVVRQRLKPGPDAHRELSCQVTQRRLEVIAKPPPAGIGMPEVAAKKSQRKLLAQFFRSGVILHQGAQVPVDRRAIPGEQFALGSVTRSGIFAVSLQKQRPTSGDLAQVRVVGRHLLLDQQSSLETSITS